MDGDHLTLLNVYYAYKENQDSQDWCKYNFLNYRTIKSADDIREQLKQIMIKLGLKLLSTDFNSNNYSINIRKALIEGYFTHVHPKLFSYL